MQDGSHYVVSSQDTLYYLPSATCSEGDTITLNNTTVLRYRLINGRFVASDYTVISNYQSTSYICHIYHDDYIFKPSDFVLPAVLIMLCFFSIIYHWFLRLRG